MQQGPAPYPAPAPPPAGRGGTGRIVGITVAVTLAAYAVVAGAAGAVFALGGSGAAAPEPGFDELPGEPCAAATRSQLGAVSAALPRKGYYEGSVSCDWVAEFSDGTRGRLEVTFRLPLSEGDYEPVADEGEAERYYAGEARELLVEPGSGDGWREVVDSDEIDDLGDEALVSHHVGGGEGERRSEARVLVRVGTVLIEVTAGETYDDGTGEADFTDDEELLVAIAERAVGVLEEREASE
ncbi:hypothetical protein [Nocardiopsis sp. FIRDI 009]|uniref:hypothetical protein n=1 Tax=Nocardiopsis sp. FIRDI 009 TaxID=714197 RepID=UPI000E26A32B|nr:hypothetical protein [Nocardiopsis sp. FIRDI 009]